VPRWLQAHPVCTGAPGPEGIASVKAAAGKVGLGLHDDLEDPLHHVAAFLGINRKLVCACYLPNCHLNFFNDTVRCYLGMVLSMPRGRWGCR
jgi:hypothetical protein